MKIETIKARCDERALIKNETIQFNNFASNAGAYQRKQFNFRRFISFTQDQKIRRHRVFDALISLLEATKDEQSAPFFLFRELKEKNEENLIFENRIVRVPGALENLLICVELKKRFSINDLKLTNVFFIEKVTIENQIYNYIRLAISDHLHRRGFIVPMFRAGLISGLKVFRYNDDKKAFYLNAKQGGN